jgi:hypothetical protein
VTSTPMEGAEGLLAGSPASSRELPNFMDLGVGNWEFCIERSPYDRDTTDLCQLNNYPELGLWG